MHFQKSIPIRTQNKYFLGIYFIRFKIKNSKFLVIFHTRIQKLFYKKYILQQKLRDYVLTLHKSKI